MDNRGGKKKTHLRNSNANQEQKKHTHQIGFFPQANEYSR